jgi:hypothetical protein
MCISSQVRRAAGKISTRFATCRWICGNDYGAQRPEQPGVLASLSPSAPPLSKPLSGLCAIFDQRLSMRTASFHHIYSRQICCTFFRWRSDELAGRSNTNGRMPCNGAPAAIYLKRVTKVVHCYDTFTCFSACRGQLAWCTTLHSSWADRFKTQSIQSVQTNVNLHCLDAKRNKTSRAT